MINAVYSAICGRWAAGLLMAGALLGPPLATPLVAQQDQNRLLQSAAQSRAKGAANATVTVYEIADFQCPYCARFATDIFPRIDSAFVRTGRVQWVFVNLPLPSHHQAWTAAKAALCAGAVADRFWAMHDRLFSTQREWVGNPDAAALFAGYARAAGIPTAAYQACVAGDMVAPLILQDVIFAASSRVSGTPTFIINNQTTVVGIKSFEEWQEIFERAIRRE